MFNLVMAVFWLIVGLAMVCWQHASPPSVARLFSDNPASFGWFAFLLVLYNLARWALIRFSARRREDTESQRRRSRGSAREEQEAQSGE